MNGIKHQEWSIFVGSLSILMLVLSIMHIYEISTAAAVLHGHTISSIILSTHNQPWPYVLSCYTV